MGMKTAYHDRESEQSASIEALEIEIRRMDGLRQLANRYRRAQSAKSRAEWTIERIAAEFAEYQTSGRLPLSDSEQLDAYRRKYGKDGI